MNTRLVDQTASELRLHRTIYLVRLIRAAILSLVVTIISMVFLAFVPFDVSFHTVWLRSIETLAHTDDFMTIGISTIVLSPVLLIWMYYSITRVWRSALQLQSTFFIFCLIIQPIVVVPALIFSVNNLAPAFSALLALYFLIMILFCIDVPVALSVAAGSPESSSFVAVCDSRLTSGAWSYLNKLVDLPRTPFRSRSAICAYLLSLIGALLLVTCFVNIITVGGVYNRLAMLGFPYGSFDPADLAEIKGRSSSWSREIVVMLFGSAVGLMAASFLQSWAKYIGGLSVSDVLSGSDKRFVLYLRSFATDEVILPKPRLTLLNRLVVFRPFPIRIEEALFDVADGFRPLIAIANPVESRANVGAAAYREAVDNEGWQRLVFGQIRSAESIVIVLKDSPGVRWEFLKILEEGMDAIRKTLFLFDPAATNDETWESIAQIALGHLKVAGVVPDTFAFQSRPIGFMFEDETIVEIQNDNWTATSYRTAFSYFLSERSGSE